MCLAQPYRRVAVPQSYARRATLEASRAEIDAAEEVLSEAVFFLNPFQFGLAMALADSYPPHYSLGALAATLTWLLGGTPTASAVIGVGFRYAAKTLYAPGSYSMATAGMRPAGR
eukprot:tig00021108_g18378.t1